MSAIHCCADEWVDSAVGYFEDIRRDVSEQPNVREAAYVSLAAIRQCQAQAQVQANDDDGSVPPPRPLIEVLAEERS